MKTDNISMKEFLKLYTAIPYKFIDEYYKFHEMCEEDPYGIDLDLVMEYLNINRTEKFYERFRKKYEENYDYIKLYRNISTKKKERVVIYKISLPTFRNICMSSKAEKAQPVRDYFAILEEFIDYYKNTFSKAINENLSKNDSYMYVILVDKNKKIFKIGRTASMRKRLQSYMTGQIKHPDIKFIMTVDEPQVIEECSKVLLKKDQYKDNKELYQTNLDQIKEAIWSCARTKRKLSEKKSDYDIYTVIYE